MTWKLIYKLSIIINAEMETVVTIFFLEVNLLKFFFKYDLCISIH